MTRFSRAGWMIFAYVLLLLGPSARLVPGSTANAQGATGATLAPPTNFSGIALSENSILWTWTDATGETSYVLEDQSGNPIITGIAADSTCVLETGLAPATSYTRRVTAFSGAQSASSNTDTVTTLSPPAGIEETCEQAQSCIETLQQSGFIDATFASQLSKKIGSACDSALSDELEFAVKDLNDAVTQTNVKFDNGKVTEEGYVAISIVIIPELFEIMLTDSSWRRVTCRINAGAVVANSRIPAPANATDKSVDGPNSTSTFPREGSLGGIDWEIGLENRASGAQEESQLDAEYTLTTHHQPAGTPYKVEVTVTADLEVKWKAVIAGQILALVDVTVEGAGTMRIDFDNPGGNFPVIGPQPGGLTRNKREVKFTIEVPAGGNIKRKITIEPGIAFNINNPDATSNIKGKIKVRDPKCKIVR